MDVSNEIKFLRFVSIAHYIVIITSIYLSYLGTKEFYYSSKIYYNILKFSFIFLAIYIIIPTLLLILVPLYKNTIKAINILMILCLSFLFVSLIIGLLINISIWKTSTESESFTANCPYHFNSSLLNTIMEKNNNKKSKICENRKCILYSENDEALGYSYICNFNSFNDFNSRNDGTIYKRINSQGNQITSNSFIKCSKIKNITISDPIIENYLILCKEDSYYNCNLFEKPKEKDYISINNKESCPNKSYNKTAYLLGVSYFLIDIVYFFFLFLMEYLFLKKIKYLNEIQEISIENKENQATINSTVNNNNQQNNNNNVNNTANFKKENTETIIVAGRHQNDELIITQKKEENDNVTTQIKDNEQKHIPNLKSSSHIKLLNLNFSDNNKENENKNHFHRRRQSLFNENNRIKLNIQDIKNLDTDSAPIKSPQNEEPNPIEININIINEPQINIDKIRENDEKKIYIYED